MKKVFLGGTHNNSKWREQLIPMLKIDYFNPVVDDWTEEHQAEEIRQRNECDFCLYVITPKMKGVYAIAEAVQDSNRKPETTLFCVLPEDNGQEFEEAESKSLRAVSNLIKSNGVNVFSRLEDVADELNKHYVDIQYNPNLIQCLIKRDGPTEIRLHKFTYLFEKNELGDFVCEVLSKEHRQYLTSLPDFRIYQKDKLSKPEFTDDEDYFMREWKLLGADRFLAYVNGHIFKFNESSEKIRAMAINKWTALLPQMDCPIHTSKNTVLKGETGNDDKSTAFEKALWKRCMYLKSDNFRSFIAKNEQQILNVSDWLWDKMEKKWERLITAKTGAEWPYKGDDE